MMMTHDFELSKSCESVSKMLTQNFQNIEQEDHKLFQRKQLVEAINEEQLIVGGIDKDIARVPTDYEPIREV